MHGKIIEVYDDQMAKEILKMSELIDKYNYISLVCILIIFRILSSQVSCIILCMKLVIIAATITTK